mgnify:CR=1 FL=1
MALRWGHGAVQKKRAPLFVPRIAARVPYVFGEMKLHQTGSAVGIRLHQRFGERLALPGADARVGPSDCDIDMLSAHAFDEIGES